MPASSRLTDSHPPSKEGLVPGMQVKPIECDLESIIFRVLLGRLERQDDGLPARGAPLLTPQLPQPLELLGCIRIRIRIIEALVIGKYHGRCLVSTTVIEVVTRDHHSWRGRFSQCSESMGAQDQAGYEWQSQSTW